MAPTADGARSRHKAAVPSVQSLIQLMQETAAAEEEPSSGSPRSVARPPPPSVARTPSQHSALQPPRFNQQQQQQGEPGDVRSASPRSADCSGSGGLRRASSAGASSGAALVHQPYAAKPSPESMRLAKRCNKALAVLERLQRPGTRSGGDGKEALPPAALRTCKVGGSGAWWLAVNPCSLSTLRCRLAALPLVHWPPCAA